MICFYRWRGPWRTPGMQRCSVGWCCRCRVLLKTRNWLLCVSMSEVKSNEYELSGKMDVALRAESYRVLSLWSAFYYRSGRCLSPWGADTRSTLCTSCWETWPSCSILTTLQLHSGCNTHCISINIIILYGPQRQRDGFLKFKYKFIQGVIHMHRFYFLYLVFYAITWHLSEINKQTLKKEKKLL